MRALLKTFFELQKGHKRIIYIISSEKTNDAMCGAPFDTSSAVDQGTRFGQRQEIWIRYARLFPLLQSAMFPETN